MGPSVNQTRKKVLVAMSGGVDSSVAAWLLREQGYDVTGVTMNMRIRQGASDSGFCGGDAVADARFLCEHLAIPHLVFDYGDLLEEKVIGKFIDEYLRGRTPNPCIDCNRSLKFGGLLEKSRQLGFDYFATGHYARIEHRKDRRRLLCAIDESKDQSYFLYPIRRADLDIILFPLGSLRKKEVRRLAQTAALPVADKQESQDICFVPHGDYRKVLADRGILFEPGEIVNRAGAVLGRHGGIVNFTIGQRGGLGISAGKPLYVLSLDAPNRRVVVGNKEDLYCRGLRAGDLNLHVDLFPDEVAAKIRYRKKPVPCRVARDGESLTVLFKEPQESVTPGQAVVFYDGDEVLGGGVIESGIGERED